MLLGVLEVADIVKEIKFRDWYLHVGKMADGSYVQVQFLAPDTNTGIVSEQHGRKWYVSPYSCPQEVVRTAHLAIVQAMLHEVDEDFFYKGKRIYGPHIDPEAMLDIADRCVFRG